MRYKITIAYDGSNYYGFQRQPSKPTIEEKLSEALFKIHKKEIKIVASGRTDKGVHAYGQVAHFDSDLKIPVNKFIKALNSLLPSDIRVVGLKIVKEDFHARFQALEKTYQYVISKEYNIFTRNYETFIKSSLDLELMKEALKMFVGEKDFSGFSAYVKDKPTVKKIFKAELKEENEKIIITFTGNNFLKYMVRRMVGTIIDIGLKRKSIDVIEKIFLTKNGNLGGKTAPANGLYLVEVLYEEDDNVYNF